MQFAKQAMTAAAWAAGFFTDSPRERQRVFNAIRLNRPEAERFIQQDELRFLAYVFARRANSRAQILQDLWVCYELGEKTGGYFVEFGATNGQTNSNTWLLETRYGWTGILAEPNPVWHADLSRNRSARIDHRCVSSLSGRTVSFITTNEADPELSGIAEFSAGDHFAEVRAKGASIDVETISLNDLLERNNAPVDIDYMSIDTEGSELDILSHFDFSKRKVRLLSVEQNARTGAEIEALLAAQGFKRVFREYSQWDGWYRATA